LKFKRLFEAKIWQSFSFRKFSSARGVDGAKAHGPAPFLEITTSG